MRFKFTHSKKTAHGRGRGRAHKTKRQHNRNHNNRMTRRQMGGMFKSLAKRFATTNINKRDGPLYGGIEVFRADVDGVSRYYIGNKPIDRYITSDKPADNAYGKLIQSKLNGITRFVDEGGAFNGMIFIDQDNFDKFSAKFPSAVSATAATASPESKNSIILENGPKGSKTMILHFGPTDYTLRIGKSVIVSITPNPTSKQTPVKNLIFSGNEHGLVVAFVLNKNAMSYCALSAYDRVNQYSKQNEFDFRVPSITKPLILQSEHQNDITSQIIPMIDNLTAYANTCADPQDTEGYMIGAMQYYNESAQLDENTKRSILRMFPVETRSVSPLAGQMSALRLSQ